jgi:hypothetical protein
MVGGPPEPAGSAERIVSATSLADRLKEEDLDGGPSGSA